MMTTQDLYDGALNNADECGSKGNVDPVIATGRNYSGSYLTQLRFKFAAAVPLDGPAEAFLEIHFWLVAEKFCGA